MGRFWANVTHWSGDQGVGRAFQDSRRSSKVGELRVC